MTFAQLLKTARAVAGMMTQLLSVRWTLPWQVVSSQLAGSSLSAGCSAPASSVGTCPSPTPREQGLTMRSFEV